VCPQRLVRAWCAAYLSALRINSRLACPSFPLVFSCGCEAFRCLLLPFLLSSPSRFLSTLPTAAQDWSPALRADKRAAMEPRRKVARFSLASTFALLDGALLCLRLRSPYEQQFFNVLHVAFSGAQRRGHRSALGLAHCPAESARTRALHRSPPTVRALFSVCVPVLVAAWALR
jgi:hypothetical protein